MQVRVSSRVLRTIDKLGGLDQYLLGEKEMRIKELGMSGWWLRWAIMQTPRMKKLLRAERERLGLPLEGVEEVVDEAEATEEGGAQMAAKGSGEVAVLPPELESVEYIPITEEEEAQLEDELVATDDAFEVEQPPHLPPLKFRVGPAAHLVLTADGWRRTKPDFRSNMRKTILKRNEFLREYVDRKMEKFENELEGVVENFDAADLTRRRDESMDDVQQNLIVDDPVSAQETASTTQDEESTREDATAIHDTATDKVEASTEEPDAYYPPLPGQLLVGEFSAPSGPLQLSEDEKRQLRKDVKRVFRKEAEAILEKKVEEVVERKAEGQKRRSQKKRQRDRDRAKSRLMTERG